MTTSTKTGPTIANRTCDAATGLRTPGIGGLYSTNTSGVTGVFYDKEREKWVASITYDHKRKLLGRFTSKDDAIKARLDKEAELFKEFAPQSNQRIEA